MTAKSTRTLITKPVKYRDFIITPKAGGFDLIDPATGRWTHFASQRYAKWSATFVSNILTRMNEHPPKRVIPEVQEDPA